MEELNLYIILILSGIIIGGILIVSVLFGMMNRIPHPTVPMYSDGYTYQQNYGFRLMMTIIAMILLYLFLATQQPISDSNNTSNAMPVAVESWQ